MIRTAFVLLMAAQLFGGGERNTREGAEHFEAGRLEEALRAFSRAEGEFPDAPENDLNIAGVHYRLGDAEGAPAGEEGPLAEALRGYQAALAGGPGGPDGDVRRDAFYNLANTLFRGGAFREAAAAYGEAIALDPEDLEARQNLERALRAADDEEQQGQSQDQEQQDQQQQEQDQQPRDQEGQGQQSPQEQDREDSPSSGDRDQESGDGQPPPSGRRPSVPGSATCRRHERQRTRGFRSGRRNAGLRPRRGARDQPRAGRAHPGGARRRGTGVSGGPAGEAPGAGPPEGPSLMRCFVATVLAALLATSVQAQESAEANVDAEHIGIEDTLTLTVSVPEERGGAPLLGELAGFEVLGSQRVSRTQIVNFQMTRATEWIYRLRPLAVGELTIPEIQVPGYLPAAPIRVRVEQGSLRPRTPDPLPSPFSSPFPSPFGLGDPFDRLRRREQTVPEVREADVFVRAEAPDSEVRVGEQVLVLYRLWSRLPVFAAAPVELAQPEGFWTEEVELPDVPWQERGLSGTEIRERRNLPGPRRERRTLNGVAYETWPLLMRAVFPTGAGERVLPGPALRDRDRGRAAVLLRSPSRWWWSGRRLRSRSVPSPCPKPGAQPGSPARSGTTG